MSNPPAICMSRDPINFLMYNRICFFRVKGYFARSNSLVFWPWETTWFLRIMHGSKASHASRSRKNIASLETTLWRQFNMPSGSRNWVFITTWYKNDSWQGKLSFQESPYPWSIFNQHINDCKTGTLVAGNVLYKNRPQLRTVIIFIGENFQVRISASLQKHLQNPH